MKNKLKNIIIVAIFPAIISIIAVLLFKIPDYIATSIQIILYGILSSYFICEKDKHTKKCKRNIFIGLIGMILSITIIGILKINMIYINETLSMIVEICMLVIFCMSMMLFVYSLSSKSEDKI